MLIKQTPKFRRYIKWDQFYQRPTRHGFWFFGDGCEIWNNGTKEQWELMR